MQKSVEKQAWFLVAAGSAILAGMLAQRGLERGWRVVSDDDPPVDPWKSDGWKSAVAWAAVSATVVAAMQLGARHGARLGWQKVTGRKPPAA